MKQLITSLFLVVSLVSCSKSGGDGKVENPIIQEASISAVVGQAAPIVLDLGNIAYGKSADGMISIKQSLIASLIPSGLVGGKLVISGADELSIISQSGCTAIKKSTGTCSIKVRANTQGLAEDTSISGQIFFHLDENTQEETFIQISATVGNAPVVETPALVSSSSSAAFGSLSISDSSKDIILTYKALSLISSSDSHEVVVPSPFVIQAASADRCSNKTISKGASCTVKIRLDPKQVSTNGLVSGNITFAGLSIPVSATISGNPDEEVPSVSQLVWIYNGAEISALDLGTLLSSNVPTKFNLYLKNKSSSSEEVNVSFSGTGFTIINRCIEKTLAPQAQCSLEVRPEQSEGVKSVAISVADQPSLSLPLEVNVVTQVTTYQTVDTTPACSSLNLQVCGGTQNISKSYVCEQYIDGVKNESYSGNDCSPLADMSPLSCQSPSGVLDQQLPEGGYIRNICPIGKNITDDESESTVVCNDGYQINGLQCQKIPLILASSQESVFIGESGSIMASGGLPPYNYQIEGDGIESNDMLLGNVFFAGSTASSTLRSVLIKVTDSLGQIVNMNFNVASQCTSFTSSIVFEDRYYLIQKTIDQSYLDYPRFSKTMDLIGTIPNNFGSESFSLEPLKVKFPFLGENEETVYNDPFLKTTIPVKIFLNKFKHIPFFRGSIEDLQSNSIGNNGVSSSPNFHEQLTSDNNVLIKNKLIFEDKDDVVLTHDFIGSQSFESNLGRSMNVSGLVDNKYYYVVENSYLHEYDVLNKSIKTITLINTSSHKPIVSGKGVIFYSFVSSTNNVQFHRFDSETRQITFLSNSPNLRSGTAPVYVYPKMVSTSTGRIIAFVSMMISGSPITYEHRMWTSTNNGVSWTNANTTYDVTNGSTYVFADDSDNIYIKNSTQILKFSSLGVLTQSATIDSKLPSVATGLFSLNNLLDGKYIYETLTGTQGNYTISRRFNLTTMMYESIPNVPINMYNGAGIIISNNKIYYSADANNQEIRSKDLLTGIDTVAMSISEIQEEVLNPYKFATLEDTLSVGNKIYNVYRQVSSNSETITMKISSDGGNSWTEPKLIMNSSGVNPPPKANSIFITEHSGILTVFVNLSANGGSTEKIVSRTSTDGGNSWTVNNIIRVNGIELTSMAKPFLINGQWNSITVQGSNSAPYMCQWVVFPAIGGTTMTGNPLPVHEGTNSNCRNNGFLAAKDVAPIYDIFHDDVTNEVYIAGGRPTNSGGQFPNSNFLVKMTTNGFSFIKNIPSVMVQGHSEKFLLNITRNSLKSLVVSFPNFENLISVDDGDSWLSGFPTESSSQSFQIGENGILGSLDMKSIDKDFYSLEIGKQEDTESFGVPFRVRKIECRP